MIKSLDVKLGSFVRDDAKLTHAGARLANQLDTYWPKARRAATGPIDVIDMFSGCGGMSAGFQAVNALVPAYRLAMAVDIDSDANRTYEANLGLRPEKLDVGELARSPKKIKATIEAVRQSPTAPLVLIGCAPCQGFSSHRNSAGESDDRNSLFLSFARIAATIKPDAVVVENVPEILTDRYWPVVEQARLILKRAGYRTVVVVHDMAEFGVPQHRFRALMIGMRKDFRTPAGFLTRSSFRTVRQAIGDLPIITPGQVSESDPMHYTASHRDSTVRTIMAVPPDGGNRPWDAGPECLRRAEAKNGRAVYEDVYGRLWWDRPAITVTAYARNPASGRYVHPDQHRGLSIREAALLQSFPRDWKFSGTFDSCFRQVGNAVPPAFSAFLATHLLGQLLRPSNAVMEDQPSGIIASLGPSFSRLIPALKAGHRQLATAQAGTGAL
jgi:DNA (cytosine-5)-methyltransferase 1